MEVSSINNRIDVLKKKCREAGIKVTHQRMEIFREIIETDEHPDAETVFKNVRKRVPTISLDTVYRTLWLLIDLGLLTTLGVARERTRFDANLHHHHHFVCIKCGLVRDFHNKEFDSIEVDKDVSEFGSVVDTQLEVHGICNACRENPG